MSREVKTRALSQCSARSASEFIVTKRLTKVSLSCLMPCMKISALAVVMLGLGIVQAAPLQNSLVFHASFDRTADADFARGDKKIYSAPKMAFPPQATPGLPASRVVTHEKSGGVTGGYLKFQKKSSEMVFFYAKGNMPQPTNSWSGTVSFWLRLTPDEDLEPGYTDPIQITSKSWDNASFFVEFTKDEKPRELRLGIYPDFEVWNPNKRDWGSIPLSEKPLVRVINPPFRRDRWTHVAFSFDHFNTSASNGSARLYVDGQLAGTMPLRQQSFTWDLDKALIMLGLSYTGDWDELAIFDRPLTSSEIARLHQDKTIH
jgi:hypothetical protein